jgi:signal transduction histidine kinase
VRPLPTVAADAARIGEVFRNLVVNGVRYNDRAHKELEIGALEPGARAGREAPDTSEGAILYVRDNGIGIPERHWSTVFDMFKRLHPRDAYGGGTGSGLAIVKKVIEKHGGRIWLASEPGRGTTFFFTLRARGAES